MVNTASNSNVLATQSWVAKMLRRFCCWTKFFSTDILRANSEVVTSNISAREGHIGELYANSIVLANSDGRMVKIKIGEDGKIDIEETLCNVFVYPNRCLLREYIWRNEDMASDFAGLTPYQVMVNFIPFVGPETSEFNGSICQRLCQADGKNKLVERTLLFTLPSGKVANRLVVLDSHGD